MSKRPAETWSLVCDWPKCDEEFCDGAYFDDTWTVGEILEDTDWRVSPDGDLHYCGRHPAAWESDHENGEPYPSPPYLLIHDPGDGVSLVTGEAS